MTPSPLHMRHREFLPLMPFLKLNCTWVKWDNLILWSSSWSHPWLWVWRGPPWSLSCMNV
jgi:hypothetical protein